MNTPEKVVNSAILALSLLGGSAAAASAYTPDCASGVRILDSHNSHNVTLQTKDAITGDTLPVHLRNTPNRKSQTFVVGPKTSDLREFFDPRGSNTSLNGKDALAIEIRQPGLPPYTIVANCGNLANYEVPSDAGQPLKPKPTETEIASATVEPISSATQIPSATPTIPVLLTPTSTVEASVTPSPSVTESPTATETMTATATATGTATIPAGAGIGGGESKPANNPDTGQKKDNSVLLWAKEHPFLTSLGVGIGIWSIGFAIPYTRVGFFNFAWYVPRRAGRRILGPIDGPIAIPSLWPNTLPWQ